MLRTPSNRRKKRVTQRINLIPILDGVFIFIFFLLMSSSFIKIHEIESKIPIVSTKTPPPTKKKPLALTLKLRKNTIKVYTGSPATLVKTIARDSDGEYKLESLHNHLIRIKRKHVKEKTIVLEPLFDIKYEELVKVMDAVRMFRTTDPKITAKSKDNVDIIVNELFSNIVFGNIQS